jgi:dephospho-CoA kinase
MFIGIIGTRYSGKSSVITYLKTRGFTVLQLRSATNDEDTSTAASSDDDGKQDMSHESGNVNSRKSIDKTGPVASTSSAPSAAAGPSDSFADLSGEFWS